MADLLERVDLPHLAPDDPGADAVFETLVAVADHRPDDAAVALAAAATAIASERAPLRILGYYADARRRLLHGDVDQARASARQLLAELAANSAEINSIELRASQVFHAVDLERLAIGLGRAGDPIDLLRVIDRAAAVVHASAPLDRSDTEFVSRLEELRGTLAVLSPSQVRPGELFSLENRLRSLARRSERAAQTPPDGDPCERLGPSAGSRMLIMYAVGEDRLWRLACRGGEGSRLDDLGPFVDVARAVRQIRFAAALLARPSRSDPALGIAKLDQAAAILEGLLLTGVDVDASTIVTLAPGRHLTSVPWRLLPSARRWSIGINAGTPLGSAEDPKDRPRSVLAVAGPGLGEQVARELELVAAAYPVAHVLAGSDATVAAVLSAMAEFDVLHLAGHGALHPTDPLLSTIDLADGPLTAYDIEMLPRSPATVVLASCDVGTVGKTGSDVNYSLASVLASRGSTQIVISPLELHDEQTAVVMPVLHRSLARGSSGREALRNLSFDRLPLQRAGDSLLSIEASAGSLGQSV